MAVAFFLPGGVPVYAYPLILGAGVTLGLGWVAWRTHQDGISRVDAGLVALFFALIGSRLGFVLLNWSYYQDHLLETIQLYRGGLTWPGAILGALLGIAVIAWVTPLTFTGLIDDLLPLLTTITISAWLACWLDGCAYGPPAPDDRWGIPTPDAWGNVIPRWPTPLFGAILALALFWGLDLTRRAPSRSGVKATLGLLILFLELFVLSFLRADPAPRWQGLRLEAWAAIALAGVASFGLIAILRSPTPEDSPSIGPNQPPQAV